MEGENHPFQHTQSIQKRYRSSTTHDFVDDMVFEILTWLPAKSLMRFNCVSKAWNTLIRHDLNFVKLHIARSRARPLATRLLFDIRIKTPCIPEHYSNVVKRAQLERFPLQLAGSINYFDPSEILICSNHCNGLVCLCNPKNSQGYLYNITTGEIKAFPFAMGYEKRWHHPQLYMGYDPATERYKLLRVVKRYKKKSCLKILTLGTNSWRRIYVNSPVTLYNCRFSSCIFLNGVLYWNNLNLGIITYFNLRDEKFVTISPPEDSRVSEIQTALWGKLIVQPSHQPKNYIFVYDEVNKVFTKFDSDSDLVEEKVVFLEAENIDKRTEDPKFIFATSSLISTSTKLVFSYHFLSTQFSRFVENITPLTFIIDV